MVFLESEKEQLTEAVEKAKELYYQKQDEQKKQFENQKRLREISKANGTIPLITRKKAG